MRCIGLTWSTMGATKYLGDPQLLNMSHAFRLCPEAALSSAAICEIPLCAPVNGWLLDACAPEAILCDCCLAGDLSSVPQCTALSVESLKTLLGCASIIQLGAKW